MKPLLAITVLAIALLACGTLPTAATMPPHATQNAPTPQITETVPTVTTLDILGGCWNVREGAGLSYPVQDVLCGGTVEMVSRASNGFIEVMTEQGVGFVCARAFGMNEECK